jgi:hypothetical protein
MSLPPVPFPRNRPSENRPGEEPFSPNRPGEGTFSPNRRDDEPYPQNRSSEPFPPDRSLEPALPDRPGAPFPPDRAAGPRHRSVPAQRGAEPIGRVEEDVELDSYLAALAPDSNPVETTLTGRFGHAQVFQLRLPELRIQQLRRLAAERGVSPGALAVDWVIERLDREDTPTGPMAVVAAEAERRRLGPLRKLGRRARPQSSSQ